METNGKNVYQHIGQSNARLDAIEKTLESIEKRVNKIDNKLSYVYGIGGAVGLIAGFIGSLIFR